MCIVLQDIKKVPSPTGHFTFCNLHCLTILQRPKVQHIQTQSHCFTFTHTLQDIAGHLSSCMHAVAHELVIANVPMVQKQDVSIMSQAIVNSVHMVKQISRHGEGDLTARRLFALPIWACKP